MFTGPLDLHSPDGLIDGCDLDPRWHPVEDHRILGEYLAVVLEQVRGRPIYVTSEPISSVAPVNRADGSLPVQRQSTESTTPPAAAEVSAGDVGAS
jgi:hypothetical protein